MEENIRRMGLSFPKIKFLSTSLEPLSGAVNHRQIDELNCNKSTVAGGISRLFRTLSHVDQIQRQTEGKTVTSLHGAESEADECSLRIQPLRTRIHSDVHLLVLI